MAFPFSFWGAFTPRSISGLQYWMSARDISAAYQASLSSLPDSVNGWVATQGTGTNQARFLPHGGGTANNYLRLPGISGNYASTPDSATVSITGDIDIRFFGALVDWTPTSSQTLIAKFNGVTGNRSYMLQVLSTGVIRLVTNPVGNSGPANVVYDSTVAPTVSDNATLGVRATLDVNDGAGGKVATFYTSTDFINWTQLGLPVSSVGTTSIFDGTEPLFIGTNGGGALEALVGRTFRAQVYNGINGILVSNFDASLGNGNSSTIVATTGETWTVNRTGADPAMIVSSPQVLFVTDDYYLLPSSSYGILNNVSGFTAFAVFSVTATPDTGTLFTATTAAGNGRAFIEIPTTPSYRIGGRRLDADSVQTNAKGTPVLRSQAIFCGTLNYAAATSQVYLNGASLAAPEAFQTPGNTSATNSTGIALGGNILGFATLNGTISELIVYNRALTAAEILKVSRFLAARTGGAITI